MRQARLSLKTGDPHRLYSPCFKHRLLVSEVVKLATCSLNCTISSLSQYHPSVGSVQTQGTPQAKQGRCLVMHKPHHTLDQKTCHAIFVWLLHQPEPRCCCQGQGLAGSGTCEEQGTHPISLHGLGLTGMCTAVWWDHAGSSCPVSSR